MQGIIHYIIGSSQAVQPKRAEYDLHSVMATTELGHFVSVTTTPNPIVSED